MTEAKNEQIGCMKSTIAELEELAERIISENEVWLKDVLIEFRIDSLDNPEVIDKTLYRLEEKIFSSPDFLFADKTRIVSLRFAFLCRQFLPHLKECRNPEKIFTLAYVLGWGRGRVEAYDNERAPIPMDILKRQMHSLMSGEGVKSGRWDTKKKNIQKMLKEPLDVARKLWEEGDTCNHSVMADTLISAYPDLNKKDKKGRNIISRACLLKELASLADSLGRPDLVAGRRK